MISLLWSEPRRDGTCPGTQRKPLFTECDEVFCGEFGPLAVAGTSNLRL